MKIKDSPGPRVQMGLSLIDSNQHRKVDQGVLLQVCVDLDQAQKRIALQHPFFDSCRDFITFPWSNSLNRQVQQPAEVLDFFDVKDLLRFQHNSTGTWIGALR